MLIRGRTSSGPLAHHPLPSALSIARHIFLYVDLIKSASKLKPTIYPDSVIISDGSFHFKHSWLSHVLHIK